jgi:hypothetical protein
MTIRNLMKYAAVGLLVATLSAMSSAAGVAAQTKSNANVQETDDKIKVDLYTKFVDTYKTNKALAHHTAKDYLRLYAKDNDQYSKYIQQWVDVYEKEDRQNVLWKLVHTDRNFIEAFAVGRVVIAEQPDHLDSLIALGTAGYLAASARNTNFDKEAIAYAKRAIQLIEAGKVPDKWDPYKGKDNTLAYLYTTIGVLQLKPTPNEAIEPLIKSAQLESELKKQPSTYYYLAQAYQAGPYAKLSADFQTKFGGKAETPESKLALEKLNQVIDVMIDAYARAVALAANDPQYAQNKTAWLGAVTPFYKFRHQDTDAGLSEFIAGVTSKPLPAKP